MTDQHFEQRFFDLSIDMLCVLDFSGRFVRLNAAWEATLGFSRSELMARPFIEFVHPDDRARTLGQNGRVRGGGQARLFENRYVCKDGSYRWLFWNSTRDTDRQVIYGVARDITERRHAEEERERLRRDLQVAHSELHTLRGFLPICSYCKSIRDDENYWHGIESYCRGVRTPTSVTGSVQRATPRWKPNCWRQAELGLIPLVFSCQQAIDRSTPEPSPEPRPRQQRSQAETADDEYQPEQRGQRRDAAIQARDERRQRRPGVAGGGHADRGADEDRREQIALGEAS